MPRLVDLSGKEFGRWVVIRRDVGSSHTKWQCRCACGAERAVASYDLVSGKSKSCGCYKSDNASERFLRNIVGHRYGKLVVVSRAENRGSDTYWNCQCDCGTRKTVRAKDLWYGKVTSCRCTQREMAAKRGRLSATHGATRSGHHWPEYNSWVGMIRRCHCPTDAGWFRYGGRGIAVCQRWRESFENFLADMGRKPSRGLTIDRIDNDGNYEPGNCRWATGKEQGSNKRNNVRLVFNGQSKILEDWASEVGIRASSLSNRLRAGWSVEKALTTPRRPYRMRSRT